MNKKKILVLAIILVSVVLFVIGFLIVTNNDNTGNGKRAEEPTKREEKDDSNEFKYEGYSVKVGYMGDNYSSRLVLKDYDSFEKYFSKFKNISSVTSRYDKKFFKSNALAVKYVLVTSGGITLDDIYASVDNGVATFSYKMILPEVGTADMNGYLVIAEVPQSVTEVK